MKKCEECKHFHTGQCHFRFTEVVNNKEVQKSCNCKNGARNAV